jgi:ComEC/Rec2-related protein
VFLNKKIISVFLITLYISIVCVRVIAVYTNRTETKSNLFTDNQSVEIIGKIISEPEDKRTYWKYVVEGEPYGKLLIKEKKFIRTESEYVISSSDIRADLDNPLMGQKISAHVRIKKPEVIVSDTGRTFDYESYLDKDGIFYIGEASSVTLIENTQKWTLMYMLFFVKNKFVESIHNSLPSPHSLLATGLVVSGKGSMSKELQEQFQRVGLIHIVVLSGSNISIIGESIYRSLFFLPVLYRTVFGAISIVLFGTMVGGGATVVRSVIMALIGLYMKLTHRTNNALVSLIIAGTLMVLYNPKIIAHDPSFQLSFVATLGLILLSRPIEICIKKTRLHVSEFTTSLVSTSLATQIFTLPLILSFSGVVSLSSLPVNILVLPIIPLIMFFVFLTGVISFIIPIVKIIPAFVSWFLLTYVLTLVEYVSGSTYSAITFDHISNRYIFSLCIAIVLFTLLLRLYTSSHSGGSASPEYKINTTPV